MRNVIFKEIKLKNFKCHREMDFSFIPNRFVSVTGKNGKGKTSIFDALLWCLFDITSKGNVGDSVIRKRTGKNCSVELTFSIGEDTYEVRAYRGHYKFGNEKHLIKNGNDITEPLRKQTTKKIEDILMPANVFINCMLFSQYITSSFIELGHSGQKEILDKILLLNKYDELHNKISNYIKKLEQKQEDDRSEINRIKSQLESYMDMRDSLCKDLEEIVEKRNRTETETKFRINELVKKIKTLQRFLDANKGVIEERDTLQDIISKNTTAIENLSNLYQIKLRDAESELVDNKTIIERDLDKEYQERISSLNNSIREKEKELNDLELEFQKKSRIADRKFNDKRSEIQTRYARLIEEIDRDIKSKEEEKNALHISISLLSVDIKNTEKKILNLKDSKVTGICPTCGQDIDNREHIENKLEVFNRDIEKIRKEIEDKNAHHKEVDNKIKYLDEKKSSLEADEKKALEILETDYRNYLEKSSIGNSNKKVSVTSAIEGLKKNLDPIEAEKQTKKQALISKAKNKLESRKNELEVNYNISKEKLEIVIKEKSEFLNNISQKAEKVEKVSVGIKTSKTELKYESESLKSLDTTFEEDRERYNRNISKINGDIKRCGEDFSKIEKRMLLYTRKTEILKFWKKAFSDTGIKAILLDETVPILNKKALELSELTDCLRVSFDSQTTLKSGKQRNKFLIKAIHTNNLSDLSELSAGESRLTNIIVLLSLRHLMETMNNCTINVLLLDEILDSLDPDNINIALNMIKSLSNERCVVLISHTLRDNIEADDYLCL